MSKLVEEAIADAKALKESAIENAKIALQEKFMPKLEEAIDAEIVAEAEQLDTTDDGDDGTPAGSDESDSATAAKDESVVAEECDEESDDKEEVEESADNLELEAILKELDLTEGDDSDEEEEVEESEESDDDKEEIEESTEISESELKELLESLELESTLVEGDEESDEEDDKEMEEENVKLKADLAEAYEAIKIMREKINEVNLMNSKLLFTNKLFNNYGDLSESQRLKILETFDRATNEREVKLVYSTIALQLENISTPTPEVTNESFASDTVTTVKKGDIIEENATIQRFKILANIPTKINKT